MDFLAELDIKPTELESWTLCQLAAAGKTDDLKRFLDENPKLSPNQTDYDGRTALHLAAENGEKKLKIKKFLLKM